MKLKLLSLFGFIIFLFSCNNNADKKAKKDAAITRQPEIAYSQIKDIIEDKEGYIWFGTPGGIYQYNGKRYYHYRSTEDTTTLCNDAVLKLFCSSKGQLFVLTEFGTSVYNNDGSYQTIFKEGEYPYCNSIAETTDGRIFLTVSDVNTYIYEYNIENKICIKRLEGYFPLADHHNRLWIWNSGEARCYSTDDFKLIKSIHVGALSDIAGVLPNGNLVYYTTQGVFIIDPDNLCQVKDSSIDPVSRVLKNISIKKTTPYDSCSVLLLTKNNFIYLWDTHNMKVIDQNHQSFPFNIASDNISSLYVDSRRNIWMGTDREGYHVAYHQQSRFQKETKISSFFSGMDITNIFRSDAGDYYVVVSHNELYHILPDQQIYRLNTSSFLSEEEIDQCFVDNRNHLWLVTNHNLIECKVNTSSITKLRILPYYCYTIGEDATGHLWFESNHNLYCLSPGSEYPELVRQNLGIVNTIRKVDNNHIIASTYAGSIYLVNTDNKEIEEIRIPRSRNTGIVCMDLTIDHSGNAWGVSYGQGLMHINLNSKEINFYNDGNIGRQMCSVIEDRQHNIWIGTLNGLLRFDVNNKRFISYYKKDGIDNDSYVPMCAVYGKDDELIFGGTKGFTVFDPKEIKPYEKCKIRFEYIFSNEELLKPYEHKRVKMQGDSIVQIRLANNNSGVYFYYTTLDYGNLNKHKTEFHLEGLDQEWHSLENEDYAYYSHIPSGKYLLQVRAVNEDGDIIDLKAVNVYVEPASWAQSWMLFGLYPMCFIILVYIGGRFYRRIKLNRDQIREITMQREQEKYANAMNIKYFTNISHEFRTPLTMIYGAFRILEDNDKNGADHDLSGLIYVMKHNTEQMLKLVNQLLDFNKIENGVLKLKVSDIDAVPLFNICINRFLIGFDQKKINIQRFVASEKIILPLDNDKFDKILSNLLSNALKYSPEEGTVSVKIQLINKDTASLHFPAILEVQSDLWLEVQVADTGIGIPESKRHAVFGRFYQIDHPESQSGWGTGIGLFYAKQLVEQHHGFIKCSSNMPKGSVFTFIIPADPALYYNDRKNNDNEETVREIEWQETASPVLSLQDKQPDNTKDEKILIVDDDAEVLNFMKLLLKDYIVECRTNPNTTLGEIGSIEPDLIISDVLMHGMNGYEFCSKIKNDPITCHLPVILLTAQSSSEHQVQGLSSGADAYVVKPFEPQYLLALVSSTLLNRKKIREVLSSSTKIDIQDEPILQSQDGVFMEKLYSYMELHLSDAEIDLDEILRVIPVSRSKFYYKVKDLTGLSPNNFFQTYKLNRAAQMIKDGNEKLIYIADATGFCSQSHFTASFKRQFGCSPSQYRERFKT